MSCFSPEKGADVIKYEDLNGTRCSYILSSIATMDGNLLMSEAVELVWWLKGPREICAADASVENVSLSDGSTGIRCQCKNGFKGDGFVNGTSCRRGESRKP